MAICLVSYEWWAKNKMPYYEEISHIPLMIWHPENSERSGSRVDALTQTTDLMPTILDFHGVAAPQEVTSYSLSGLLRGETGQRKQAILGMFAGPVCVTDGQYSFFLFPADLSSPAPPIYTIMPSHMEKLFSMDEMKSSRLVDCLPFTKGAPLLRIEISPEVGETGLNCVANWEGGAALYDLYVDPSQENPLEDELVVERLTQAIRGEFMLHDAPAEVFAHYGLKL